MMAKMKYSHWELLLNVYQKQKMGNSCYTFQCHKALLKTCLKQGWFRQEENDRIVVTEQGIEAAKQFAPLYEFHFTNMGQTY